jgi:hypothetical protein
MPSDGFHPFGGKVSKRFRDSVRSSSFMLGLICGDRLEASGHVSLGSEADGAET